MARLGRLYPNRPVICRSVVSSIDKLADDCNDNSFDTRLWETWNVPAGGSITETNQRWEFSHNIASTVISTSLARYDIAGSTFQIQIVDAGNQSQASHEAGLRLWLDGSNMLWAFIGSNSIELYQQVNSSNSWLGGDIAYNSSVHRFLRFREASGTIYLDYSTDGGTWTNITSAANPFGTTICYPQVYTGAWNTETSGNTAVFDNINVPMAVASPTITATVTATASLNLITEMTTDAPTVWWHLNESSGSLIDSVAAHNLTVTGSPTYSATGLSASTGTCLTFSNATLQYGEVTSSTDFYPTSLSVEALYQSNGINGNNRIIQYGVDNSWALLYEYGYLKFTVSGRASAQYAWVTDTHAHHVAGTYNGTGLGILYLDGVEVAREQGTTGAPAVGTALRIAQKPTGSAASDGWNGKIDEVAIYNKVLTPARIAAHALASGIPLAAGSVITCTVSSTVTGTVGTPEVTGDVSATLTATVTASAIVGAIGSAVSSGIVATTVVAGGKTSPTLASAVTATGVVGAVGSITPSGTVTATVVAGAKTSPTLTCAVIATGIVGTIGTIAASVTGTTTVSTGQIGNVSQTITEASTVTGAVALTGAVTVPITTAAIVTATVNLTGAVTAPVTAGSTVSGSIAGGSVSGDVSQGIIAATAVTAGGRTSPAISVSQTVTAIVGTVASITPTITATTVVSTGKVGDVVQTIAATTVASAAPGSVTQSITAGAVVTAAVGAIQTVSIAQTVSGTTGKVAGSSPTVSLTSVVVSPAGTIPAITYGVTASAIVGLTGAVVQPIAVTAVVSTGSVATVTAVVTVSATVSGVRGRVGQADQTITVGVATATLLAARGQTSPVLTSALTIICRLDRFAVITPAMVANVLVTAAIHAAVTYGKGYVGSAAASSSALVSSEPTARGQYAMGTAARGSGG